MGSCFSKIDSDMSIPVRPKAPNTHRIYPETSVKSFATYPQLPIMKARRYFMSGAVRSSFGIPGVLHEGKIQRSTELAEKVAAIANATYDYRDCSATMEGYGINVSTGSLIEPRDGRITPSSVLRIHTFPISDLKCDTTTFTRKRKSLRLSSAPCSPSTPPYRGVNLSGRRSSTSSVHKKSKAARISIHVVNCDPIDDLDMKLDDDACSPLITGHSTAYHSEHDISTRRGTVKLDFKSNFAHDLKESDEEFESQNDALDTPKNLSDEIGKINQDGDSILKSDLEANSFYMKLLELSHNPQKNIAYADTVRIKNNEADYPLHNRADTVRIRQSSRSAKYADNDYHLALPSRGFRSKEQRDYTDALLKQECEAEYKLHQR